MEDEKTGQASKGEEGNPPRKTAIFRIARALLHRYGANNAQKKKEYTFHQENERTMASWSRRVGYFTAALFVASLISNLIIYGQLREMQSSSADTQKLVDAAQKSAKAAQDAIEVAKDTAKRQLRAYIYPDAFTVEAVGNKEALVCEFKNTGQTPALDFEINGLVSIEKDGILIGQSPVISRGAYSSIGREASFNFRFEFKVADDFSEGLKSGRIKIHFSGNASFSDIFGERHINRFSFSSLSFAGDNLLMTPGETKESNN